MSYSPEQIEEQADRVGIVGEDVGKTAKMLRFAAATLRQQAARVDEDMVERAASAFMRVRGLGMARPWEGMLESSRESYRPAFRAALEAALAAQPAERQGDVEAEFSAWLQKEMPPGTVISNPAWWAKRIAGRVHLIRPAQPAPLLAKYQSCGCIVCTCEDEEQCQGCGAQHCGTHPVGQIPSPAYAQFTHPAASVGVPDGMVLVPREPTQAMYEQMYEVKTYVMFDRFCRDWTRMLAAAPSAPQGEG